MNRLKILSGDELVARGTTKTDANLPEIGLKDVIPNGSWLEQKQIQSALEARKHLIEVERIEKSGVLSHAEWREELMLAEVLLKAGSHWQYLGHNVGKQLFLKPEETLFLMEVNCLQLKYNEVTVSLQQAYSLLLRGKISLFQYRVYASLSRLGYKLYRHEVSKTTEYEKRINLSSYTKNEREKEKGLENETEGEETVEDNIDVRIDAEMCDNPKDNVDSNSNNKDNEKSDTCTEDINKDKDNNGEPETVSSTESNVIVGQDHSYCTQEMETTECDNDNINSVNTSDTLESHSSKTVNIPTPIASRQVTRESETLVQRNKLNMLLNRKLKPSKSQNIQIFFEKIPDLSQNNTVTVSIPEEQYIPRNVFLNQTNYELNLKNIRMKTRNSRRESSELRPYANEEVNGLHVRRIRDSFSNVRAANWDSSSTPTVPNFQFRPHSFWRPQHMSYFPYNIFYQRPFMPLMNFMPRLRFFPRPPSTFMPPRFSNFQPNNDNRNIPNDTRKRRRSNTKQMHLQAIKNLSVRLKHLVQLGNRQTGNVESLQRLIQTFNIRYNMSLTLTDNFDVVNNETIIETITLDDDEASNRKRSRTEHDVKYTENLNNLKLLATKLKVLETSDKSNSRHRRAFSQLLKKFNKSYKADIYLNSNFEIIDRRYIKLDSSSDSDCVIDETPTTSGKKLKNPFSILKKLSLKHNPRSNPNMNEQETSMEEEVKDNKYSEEIKRVFYGNWLPSEDDFGRAEVFPLNLMKTFLVENKNDEYMFDFIKSESFEYENWLEIKISFLKSIAESSAMMRNEMAAHRNEMAAHNNSTGSIINSEDCKDIPSVLKKLSIIETNKAVLSESSLLVDFDVYNRDVQNFKKSNRPNPHFRIVCIEESSMPPSGEDIATLHAKYDDNVPILFAVVGIGSISYLQMNPNDLPVYIPSNDLT